MPAGRDALAATFRSTQGPHRLFAGAGLVVAAAVWLRLADAEPGVLSAAPPSGQEVLSRRRQPGAGKVIRSESGQGGFPAAQGRESSARSLDGHTRDFAFTPDPEREHHVAVMIAAEFDPGPAAARERNGGGLEARPPACFGLVAHVGWSTRSTESIAQPGFAAVRTAGLAQRDLLAAGAAGKDDGIAGQAERCCGLGCPGKGWWTIGAQAAGRPYQSFRSVHQISFSPRR